MGLRKKSANVFLEMFCICDNKITISCCEFSWIDREHMWMMEMSGCVQPVRNSIIFTRLINLFCWQKWRK